MITNSYSTLIPKANYEWSDEVSIYTKLADCPWPERHTTVAFDFESNGVDVNEPGFKLYGLSIAWREDGHLCSWYLDLTKSTREDDLALAYKLCYYALVAHNATFDLACLAKLGGDIWNYIIVADTYGLFKQLSSEQWTGQSWGLKAAQEEVLGLPRGDDELAAWLEDNPGRKMWEAPLEILGRYACYDTQSTFYLYEHLWPLTTKPVQDRHRAWLRSSVYLNVERQLWGMRVDTDEIERYYHGLLQRIDQSERDIKQMPEIADIMEELWTEQLKDLKDREPPKYRKDGETTARWTKWSETVAEFEAARLPKFNINSNQQLEWLFFDKLGYEPIKTTSGGARSTDKKVLPWLGPVGQALVEHNKLTTERRYVKPCYELSKRDGGYVHPIMNSNGTVTHRMSGGGGKAVKHKLNIQQQPKVPGYMECYRARDGHAIVSFDFPSLENRVLAAASKDENLLKLYGPGRPPNCGYLFLCSQVPGLDVVRELYDPDNPVNLSEAKAKFKKQRGVGKVSELSMAYGAGPAKVQQELALAGFPMELEQVREIWQARKNLYPGAEAMAQDLEREWNRNGGYILDGFGCPHPVAPDKLKDLVNRYCQTTGHTMLMYLNWKIHELRVKRGVTMHPWIPDLHDECMYEVPLSEVDVAKTLMEDAVQWVDDNVNLTDMSFVDSVDVIYNLRQAKCEE